jgi:hypothetical protein
MRLGDIRQRSLPFPVRFFLAWARWHGAQPGEQLALGGRRERELERPELDGGVGPLCFARRLVRLLVEDGEVEGRVA